MLDFLCIGAQKAATTWLYRHLSTHPNILFPHGKEVHYWDWVERGKRPPNPAWYKSLFEGCDTVKRGDMTPCYSLLSPDTIAEIKALCPETKVFYIARNPIERAWSAALMGASIMRMEPEEVSDEWLLSIIRSKSSQHRSDHQRIITDWQQVFGAERFKVFFYDDLLLDEPRFLENVMQYIEVDAETYFERIDSSKKYPSHKINVGSKKFSMSNEVYNELLSLYTDKILRLQDFLQRDLSHWIQTR